jgi:hypothetical protein
MMESVSRRWSDLSERDRRLIIVAGAFESALKIRPSEEINGPKWAWATAITVVNSVGAVPAAYFLLGRRRTPSI